MDACIARMQRPDAGARAHDDERAPARELSANDGRARSTVEAPAAAAPAGIAAVSAEARALLDTWIELLVTWNARMDLTAARDAAELCDLMLADALVLAAHVPQGARVVDVGSGAGAPGLPLALLRPDLAVTLVEPLAKRVAFLRTVLGTTRRQDVRLERARGEQITERFDVAISRATLPPPAWLALGATLVARGGSVWVLLAKEDAPSVEGAGRVEEIAYTWPGTGASRRAVRYDVVGG